MKALFDSEIKKCINCGDDITDFELELYCLDCYYEVAEHSEQDDNFICNHIDASMDNEGFKYCNECGETNLKN